MRFGFGNFDGTKGDMQPLFLSLADAGSIGAPAGGAPAAAPPSAPSAPAPADSGGGYVPGVLGRIAEAASNPPPEAPPVVEPALVATPEAAPVVEGQPAPESAAPIAQPVPEAATPPEQFEALKAEVETHKQAVAAKEAELATVQSKVAEYANYAPQIEAMQSTPGLFEAVKFLTPAIEARLEGFTDPRAGAIGHAIIKNLDQYDQGLCAALVNGVMVEYNQYLTDTVFQSVGMSKQDIPDYQRWKASGGAAAPAYTLNEFPVADADGIALIPITDPTTGAVSYDSVDLNDGNGLYKYNTEKRNFERAKEDRQREEDTRKADGERQETERKASEARVKGEQDRRVGTWLQDLQQAEAAAYNALSPEFVGEFEWMHQAASSMAHGLMGQDANWQRLLADGRKASANGEGKAEAIKLDLQKLSNAHIAKAVSHYSDLVKRISAAEAATTVGKPRLPADAPVITPETRVVRTEMNTQPVTTGKPQLKPGEGYDEFLNRTRAERAPQWAAQAR